LKTILSERPPDYTDDFMYQADGLWRADIAGLNPDFRRDDQIETASICFSCSPGWWPIIATRRGVIARPVARRSQARDPLTLSFYAFDSPIVRAYADELLVLIHRRWGCGHDGAAAIPCCETAYE
jgi:hypothetical protein